MSSLLFVENRAARSVAKSPNVRCKQVTLRHVLIVICTVESRATSHSMFSFLLVENRAAPCVATTWPKRAWTTTSTISAATTSRGFRRGCSKIFRWSSTTSGDGACWRPTARCFSCGSMMLLAKVSRVYLHGFLKTTSCCNELAVEQPNMPQNANPENVKNVIRDVSGWWSPLFGAILTEDTSFA